MKKYIIFDLDWTLIESMSDTVKIILKYLSNIPKTDIAKAKYIFSTTPWMALKNQIKLVYEWEDHTNSDNITWEIYKILLDHDACFFEWVIDKINELNKNYKLFLTTWNSTQVAIKHLKKWWIINHFELIYWSDKILKWMDHLNIFKNYSNDENFFSKSIYVWDGKSDRLFANEAWIDFIHIWNEKIDKYEIKSVKEINTILDNLN